MDLKHIIYPTLATRTIIGGVPREYWVVVMIIAGLFWNLFNNLIVAGITGAVVWFAGYLYTKSDPDFMAILVTKRIAMSQTKGTDKRAGNRYLA